MQELNERYSGVLTIPLLAFFPVLLLMLSTMLIGDWQIIYEFAPFTEQNVGLLLYTDGLMSTNYSGSSAYWFVAFILNLLCVVGAGGIYYKLLLRKESFHSSEGNKAVAIVIAFFSIMFLMLIKVSLLINAFLMSFKDYSIVRGMSNSPYVGLRHYRVLFDSFHVKQHFTSTFLSNIVILIITLVLSLFIGLLFRYISKKWAIIAGVSALVYLMIPFQSQHLVWETVNTKLYTILKFVFLFITLCGFLTWKLRGDKRSNPMANALVALIPITVLYVIAKLIGIMIQQSPNEAVVSLFAGNLIRLGVLSLLLGALSTFVTLIFAFPLTLKGKGKFFYLALLLIAAVIGKSNVLQEYLLIRQLYVFNTLAPYIFTYLFDPLFILGFGWIYSVMIKKESGEVTLGMYVGKMALPGLFMGSYMMARIWRDYLTFVLFFNKSDGFIHPYTFVRDGDLQFELALYGLFPLVIVPVIGGVIYIYLKRQKQASTNKIEI